MIYIIKVDKYYKSTCDIDYVLRSLLLAFPGSEVTSEDSFETERARVRSFIEARERAGRPVNNPAALLGSIDSKEMYYGKAKNVLVRAGEGCILQGWITSINILLRSNRAPTDSGIDTMAVFLKSLNLGDVEVRAVAGPDS